MRKLKAAFYSNCGSVYDTKRNKAVFIQVSRIGEKEYSGYLFIYYRHSFLGRQTKKILTGKGLENNKLGE